MTDKQEDRVYNSQRRYIRDHFGKGTAANFGWFIDEDSIQTKVYGEGVLTSWIDGKDVVHQFTAFPEIKLKKSRRKR